MPKRRCVFTVDTKRRAAPWPMSATCPVCQSTSFSVSESGQNVCNDCGTQMFAISQLEETESDLAHIAKIGGRLKRISRRGGRLLRAADGVVRDCAEDVLVAMLTQYQFLLRYLVGVLVSEFGCPPRVGDTVKLLWQHYLLAWYVAADRPSYHQCNGTCAFIVCWAGCGVSTGNDAER